MTDVDELIQAAMQARLNAYAPYSNYQVGAAVLCPEGRIFTGANVENISFGLTLCAERVAITHAVSSGARLFTAIAIVTESHPPATPCGACRQVITEFAPDADVICVNTQHEKHVFQASKLLPHLFETTTLQKVR